MIEVTQGNLLESPVEALVNTVNTVGVMGRGIALQFKQAYPAMFRAYQSACKLGQVHLGKMQVFDLGGLAGGPHWIINFPTKSHWRSPSRMSDIQTGLKELVGVIERLRICSIAIPPLGCGNGGLDWREVRPLIEAALADVPSVHVMLFAPTGTPEPDSMPNRTKRPKVTKGQAALIILMHRYLNGLLDPFISLLEIHKLMYFLQESGQILNLKYEAKSYGPFASNLRHVLIRLEKHYTQGYGDGKDKPTTLIELLPGAVEEAEEFLRDDNEIRSRMDRVATLIEGFEDSYGLELLSTVHWVMRNNPDATKQAKVAITEVQRWNARKRRTLKAEHITKAWQRLVDQNWHLTENTLTQSLPVLPIRCE